MKLALVVAAPRGSDGQAFFSALEADGIFTASDVDVRVVQDFTQPVAKAPPGIGLATAPHRSSIFELWGLGLREVTAPYVALLDIRCPIEPGWLAAITRNLQDDPSVLFGPVACGWPPNSPNIVGYLVEYVQFHPPLSRHLKEVPGVNLVVASTLAQHGDVLKQDGFVKTRLLAHLSASGVAPRSVAQSVATYRKAFGFSDYCLHRYRHGRCFGADRRFMNSGRRILAVLATPALPVLRAWRIARAAREAGLFGAYWRWLHRILAAETAWSLGEFSGYLFGEGGSRAFLR